MTPETGFELFGTKLMSEGHGKKGYVLFLPNLLLRYITYSVIVWMCLASKLCKQRNFNHIPAWFLQAFTTRNSAYRFA